MKYWTQTTPTEEAWYWIKHKIPRPDGYRGTIWRVVPACVHCFKDGTASVKSAYGDTWIEGPNHGGNGLKTWIKKNFIIDKSLYFGERIKFPDKKFLPKSYNTD
jgi:hypothetical protein